MGRVLLGYPSTHLKSSPPRPRDPPPGTVGTNSNRSGGDLRPTFASALHRWNEPSGYIRWVLQDSPLVANCCSEFFFVSWCRSPSTPFSNVEEGFRVKALCVDTAPTLETGGRRGVRALRFEFASTVEDLVLHKEPIEF